MFYLHPLSNENSIYLHILYIYIQNIYCKSSCLRVECVDKAIETYRTWEPFRLIAGTGCGSENPEGFELCGWSTVIREVGIMIVSIFISVFPPDSIIKCVWHQTVGFIDVPNSHWLVDEKRGVSSETPLTTGFYDDR